MANRSTVHPAAASAEALLAECDLRRTRRSGPGGQHRNKVETAVVLTHRPTGVSAEASERRSQSQNLRSAVFRLRVKLALAKRRPVAADRAPSDLWQSRIRGGRIAVNPAHDDFPALLAEALDVLADCDMDVARSAERLGASPSQLVRLLRLTPGALEQVNRRRAELALRPLR